MVQSNYFVEIRRRALEIDWRVPISIYEEGDLIDAAAGDLLLNGRYLRIERDLLVVSPHDRGVLFHRYFDPDAQFNGSPLRLKPGHSIPMSWAAVMVSAPVFAIESDKPSAAIDATPATGLAVETGKEPFTLTLAGDYRLGVGADTRLWLVEGARGKNWAFRLLRGSVLCESLVERPPAMRIETLRGQGRLSGGALAVQMMHPRHPDLALATGVVSGEATRWEMGGFGYSLSGEKMALTWTQPGGAPDSAAVTSLNGRLSLFLAGALGKTVGKDGDGRSDAVAKPYRAPKPSAVATGSAVKKTKATSPTVAAPTVSIARNGHAPAIAPITILDKPNHSIPKFDGDIELRLTVDQGTLFCRRADLVFIDGSGTGSLVLRGPLPAVNATLGAVTYETPSEAPAKPAYAGPPIEKRPVMVTLFARIGGRMFETNLPLEDFLTGGAPSIGR